MKISDKELDELFQSKLNDLEVEPNEMVWNNLTDQISHNKNKKKSIVSVLKIAASIIVMISVGLLLLQKNNTLVKKTVPNRITKAKLEQQKSVVEQTENIKSDEPMLLLSDKNKEVKTARQSKSSSKKRVIILAPNVTSELKLTDEMLVANIQPEKKNNTIAASLITSRIVVVPDTSTRFSIKAGDEETVAAIVKPQNLPAKNSTPAVVTKRKGIRSIGDVVNLVMAKVDKRQDKLIEFTDSDDGDESNVTGINLGIISIKKEK
ncbi:MAG: hypothetical protein ACRYFA_14965 [Janthinobacterium lividum]